VTFKRANAMRQQTGEASMKGKPQLQKFVRRARELGAVGAKVIPAETVLTAPWVRMKCQFGCGGFNSSLCCPPHSPKPEETREVIACYRRALLIHCKSDVRPTKIVLKLEREIFLDGFYKAFGLGAGPCRLCRTCNLKECTRPDDARPSMEACGIDVFATARANGFPIEVVRDYSCDENRYGVVLIE
jgi:predicted metal-binding protein